MRRFVNIESGTMLFIKKAGSSKKAGTHIHDIYLGKSKCWIIASIKRYYEKVC